MRPIIPHLYGLQVIQTYSGVRFENVLHFYDSTDPDPADVASALQHGWEATAGIAAQQMQQIGYDMVVATNYGTADDPIEVPWGGTPLLGHGHITSGEILPLSDTSVTTLTTGAHGRRGRGRIYISGHPYSFLDITNMKWNVFAHAELKFMVQNTSAAWVSTLGSGTPAILSRVGSGTPESPVPEAYVISGWRFNVGIGSQRKRDNRMAPA